MDLTEFRAAYPGLYSQAFEAGREADRERVEQLFALAEAAGNIHLARRSIEYGHSVQDALPQLRAHASKDDTRAAAFIRKLETLGLEGGTSDLQLAKRLAATMGGQRAVNASAADIVADIVLGVRPATEPQAFAANASTAMSHDEKAARVVALMYGDEPAAPYTGEVDAVGADGTPHKLREGGR